MMKVIHSFKKSILWRQDKQEEIEYFDQIHAEYVKNICKLGNMKRMVIFKDKGTAVDQKEESRFQQTTKKFQLAIRRILKINDFANSSGEPFDLQELDLYKMTIQKVK